MHELCISKARTGRVGPVKLRLKVENCSLKMILNKVAKKRKIYAYLVTFSQQNFANFKISDTLLIGYIDYSMNDRIVKI